MSISREELNLLKQLCRIECDKEEEEALFEKLNSTMKQIDAMLEVNTDNVQECFHVVEGVENVLRDDEVKDVVSRDELLQNAPDQVGGMIRVPPVMKRS
jgi:aspartyl-tRNA(Asn)/glutamyl-tRNA(Gln) amidotransferase subunit C